MLPHYRVPGRLVIELRDIVDIANDLSTEEDLRRLIEPYAAETAHGARPGVLDPGVPDPDAQAPGGVVVVDVHASLITAAGLRVVQRARQSALHGGAGFRVVARRPLAYKAVRVTELHKVFGLTDVLPGPAPAPVPGPAPQT